MGKSAFTGSEERTKYQKGGHEEANCRKVKRKEKVKERHGKSGSKESGKWT